MKTTDIGDGMLVIDMTNEDDRLKYEALAKRRRTNKYHAEAIQIDGIRFDSKAEARRYQELRLLLQAGQIDFLQVHPSYVLEVNGQAVASYEADFRYHHLTPPFAWVVEDVKSPATITPLFKLKKKLMKAIHNIEVVEVMM